MDTMKSTPVPNGGGKCLLERRRSFRILIREEKMKRLPSHPLHQISNKESTRDRASATSTKTSDPSSGTSSLSTQSSTEPSTIQWVPAHGLSSNEHADSLTKEDLQLPQPQTLQLVVRPPEQIQRRLAHSEWRIHGSPGPCWRKVKEQQALDCHLCAGHV